MNKCDIKILLVDDEPDILEIVGYNLSTEGYQISTAKNGVEAVKKAKKEKPQLIILDVMMPEMDGIEACEQIRKIPDLEKTIITFLTARGEDYSQVALRMCLDREFTSWAASSPIQTKVKLEIWTCCSRQSARTVP